MGEHWCQYRGFQKYHGFADQKTKRGEWYNVLASFRAP